MNPPIKVVMTTWFPPGAEQKRIRAAQTAYRSWVNNLSYEGELSLHIADDGSDENLLGRIEAGSPLLWTNNTTYSRQERRGVGASLNAGILQAVGEEALVLYLVDDWELLQPLDLTPWAKLLMTEESIGMVRLGLPHPDLTGKIIHHPDCDWYMKLDRHHFVYAHRPSLYHQRFFDAYGLFAEGVNAYECERLYNEKFCNQSGPDIVLALPHPWRHIESVELAGVVPG